MIYERLWQELDKVASRYRKLRLWRGLSAAWLMAAATVMLLWAAGRVAGTSALLTVPVLGTIAAIFVVVGVVLVRLSAPGHDWVARQVESAFPDLKSCLMAAIEQRPDLAGGRFGFLQTSVIREALIHANTHGWQEVVSRRRMATAVAAQFATFGLFVLAVLGATLWVSPKAAWSAITRSDAVAAPEGFAVEIEPGDTEIEKGTSLLVLARVTGAIPADSMLIFQPADNDAKRADASPEEPVVEPTRMPMTRSLNDPVFGARIPAVNAPLDYHVELGSETTKTYHVTVFEYPRLERIDARLVYPRYTGLEERLVQDVRTISVVEGTDVTVTCWLNKPVAEASFTEKDFPPIVLNPVVGDKPSVQATIHAEKSRRLKLALVDAAGRRNVQQSELVIQVVPDQPPTLKIVFPAKDQEVSPLEELDVKATAYDDFGLQRTGVTYSMAGQEPIDVVISEKAAAKQRHPVEHTIRLEDLKAEPDQLLTYYFWADDFAPDGTVRRTFGDMYFAEVRPFDEIYRQGQPPPGGAQQQRQQQQGGQNAQQAQQLAELQKEIINATWKVIRREIGSKLTPTFDADAGQLVESQSSALEQASALGERLRDEQSQAHLAKVLEAMQKAIDQLKAAHDQPSHEPLRAARSAEEAAYQGLLKLRAREHEVTRQQAQPGQRGQASARSQQQRQQMRNLDLKDEQNRYEQQRAANSQAEDQQAREERQVLNRLRELARRQHDLNEQLKDLQSALQEAKTPEKKEEIRRQLKRLQEEQEQVLRDTDELQSRMESPENAERMAEERQQLEQTREQVRRTSEALEKEMVTQAAASGTRAEEELDELRDEFRRRASTGLGGEMRQLIDSARDLEKQQQDLSQRLAPQEPQSGAKSLRDEPRRDDVARDLTDQRRRLAELVERMRQTIEQAEKTEPLVSEKLYEAARVVQDQNLDRSLETAGRALQQGFLEDARQQEQQAGRGITKLREGIERAAETVLGDETDSMRRAREQLRDLSRELNQEIERNQRDQQSRDGNPAQEGAAGRRGQRDENSARQSAATRNGQRAAGEQGQPDEQSAQPGQGQPGQPRAPGKKRAADPQEGQPGQQGQRGQRGQNQRGQGQQGEPQPGQEPGDQQPGDQPGEGQPGQQGQRGQQGQQGQEGQQGPQGQQGQGGQQGQQGQGRGQQGQQGQNQQGQRGAGQPGDQQGVRGARAGGARAGGAWNGGNPNAGGPFGPNIGDDDRIYAPITGNDFLDWSDRLRDVEELVSDPELRAEAARIRDRARAIRAEVKRHSKSPNWDLIRVNVAEPLVELTDRVAEEVLRRGSRHAVVPLDRDPVPPRYSEKTRRYYERLGSGQ